MFINSCVSGEKVNITATCIKKNQGMTTAGVPYLILTLRDKTASIEARLWNASTSDLTDWQQGKAYNIEGVANSYNQVLQLKIISYQILHENEFNPRDLIDKAPINSNVVYEEILNLIKNFKNKHYQKIMLRVLQEYGDRLKRWPAAIKVHHALTSGLIWHTYTMLESAQAIVKIYQDRLIDPDLLYSGIILHDLGKVIEIKSFLVSEITLAGKMVGHISIMSALLEQICQDIDVDNRYKILLQHCILSSHGKLEFGSPVVPRLMEAEILSTLDNLDARIFQIHDHISKVPEWTETKRISTCENRSYLNHYLKKTSSSILEDETNLERQSYENFNRK